MSVQADDPVFQHQGDSIAHIRPEGFHLAFSDLEGTFGGDGGQAQGAAPVDAPAIGANGDQRHVGIVGGQGAEVLQRQVQGVVEELDGLAGSQVLEVQIAFAELDAGDA